jgi:uncharacterized hydrophobic protein (TIGR00271 family)
MVKIPFLHTRKAQSLTEANEKEIGDAVRRLIALSTHDYGYYLFLVLSILITTAGLLLHSAPVIIGGMIIAPILTPLLACGLALLLFEMKGLVRALTILVLSCVIALLLSSSVTMMSMVTDPETVMMEYLPVVISPELYLIIAVSSGIAGAFAFVKSHLSSSMSGVAVSASLVPPLCAIGIGVALKDAALVEQSFLVFMLNALGIILASSLVFWVLGFRFARELEEKIVEETEGGA